MEGNYFYSDFVRVIHPKTCLTSSSLQFFPFLCFPFSLSSFSTLFCCLFQFPRFIIPMSFCVCYPTSSSLPSLTWALSQFCLASVFVPEFFHPLTCKAWFQPVCAAIPCVCDVCSPGYANLSPSSTELLNACVVDGKSLINTNSICAFSFFVSQQSAVSGRKNSLRQFCSNLKLSRKSCWYSQM